MNTSANAYRPFQIGLLASGLFFVGYIAFGWQGWGTPAAVEQAVGEVSRWCERVQPGLFHEPVNALSNIGFMVAGLWMLWRLGGDVRVGRQGQMFGLSPVALLYAGAVVWLGPGSLLMHGTHTGWGGWADNLSMVMYILIPWLINVGAMGRWTTARLLGIYATLVIVYGHWSGRQWRGPGNQSRFLRFVHRLLGDFRGVVPVSFATLTLDIGVGWVRSCRYFWHYTASRCGTSQAVFGG